MSFTAFFAYLACPSCGEPMMPAGMKFGREPEHLAETCPHCKKVIELRKDPATGEMAASVARPA